MTTKMKICLLLAILVRNVAVDAFEDTYWFPPTKKTLTHGLCAIGFEYVRATSTSEALTFATITDFDPQETKMWPKSPYYGDSGFCDRGTYLQPNSNGDFPTETQINITGSIDPSADVAKICYFVTRHDGGWGRLPGFTFVHDYNWDAGKPGPHADNPSLPQPVRAKIYCRTLREEVTDMWEGRQIFPPTTKSLTHGLCAIGFESVHATSSSGELTFANIPDFDPQVTKIWPRSPYYGASGFCDGGTYLQPNSNGAFPTETKINITGSIDPSADVAKICYFVNVEDEKDGGWGRLPGFTFVNDYNWDAGRYLPKRVRAEMYCRTFRNGNNIEEAVLEEGIKVKLDEGIKVKFVDGSAEYPSGAVKIVAQNLSTVTVELRQAWGSAVDKFFYRFKSDLFTSQCFEEDKPEPNVLLDTITIQCNVMSPFANLNLCLQDTTGDLLHPFNDQGTVSKCCHSDAPLGTPTVCYTLEIDCDDSTKRRLRGLSHHIKKNV